MKNITYIVEKTAEQLKLPESVVNKIVRSFCEDIFEFKSKKLGYNIVFPEIGKFEFRVTSIDAYIENKRKSLAEQTELSLRSGLNSRTYDAAIRRIHSTRYCIRRSLMITDEFLTKHARYHKKKRKKFHQLNSANISRLSKYLDVVMEVKALQESGTDAAQDMPEMHLPPESL